MTKHRDNCQRVFKKYDKDCPRCQELANGAAPRDGWQRYHFAVKKQQAEDFTKSMNAHFLSPAHQREVVCTFGDW